MIELLEGTLEYQNWGWNVLTIGFFGTLIFTVLQGYGLLKQGASVWKSRSGESVSVMLFGYSCFYFFSFLFYGLGKQSIAMVFNGCLSFAHLPILFGLLNFKGFTKGEWLGVGSFTLMVPALIFPPDETKDVLLTVFLFGILFVLGKQLYELKTIGKKGSLEEGIIVSFMVTSFFWFLYALAIGSVPLAIFNPLAFILWVATFRLLRKVKREEKKEKFQSKRAPL